MNGIGAFLKRIIESLLTTSGYSKVTVMQPGRRPSPEPNHVLYPDLRLLATTTVRRVLFKPPGLSQHLTTQSMLY
jgi:hypothetical protein